MLRTKHTPVPEAYGRIRKLLIFDTEAVDSMKCMLKRKYLDMFLKMGGDKEFYFFAQKGSGDEEGKECAEIDKCFPDKYFRHIAAQGTYSNWAQDLTNFLQVHDNGVYQNRLLYCNDTKGGSINNLDRKVARVLQEYFGNGFELDVSKWEWEGGNQLIGRSPSTPSAKGEYYMIIGIESLYRYLDLYQASARCIRSSGHATVDEAVILKAQKEFTRELSAKFNIPADNIHWLALEPVKNTGQTQPIYHIDLYLTLGGPAQSESTEEMIFIGSPKMVSFEDTESWAGEDFECRSDKIKETREWLGALAQKGLDLRIGELPLFMYYFPGLRTPLFASYNNCIVENTGKEKIIYLPGYQVAVRKETAKYFYERLQKLNKENANEEFQYLLRVLTSLNNQYPLVYLGAAPVRKLLSIPGIQKLPDASNISVEDALSKLKARPGLYSLDKTSLYKLADAITDYTVAVAAEEETKLKSYLEVEFGFDKVEFVQCDFPQMAHSLGGFHCMVKVMEREEVP